MGNIGIKGASLKNISVWLRLRKAKILTVGIH